MKNQCTSSEAQNLLLDSGAGIKVKWDWGHWEMPLLMFLTFIKAKAYLISP